MRLVGHLGKSKPTPGAGRCDEGEQAIDSYFLQLGAKDEDGTQATQTSRQGRDAGRQGGLHTATTTTTYRQGLEGFILRVLTQSVNLEKGLECKKQVSRPGKGLEFSDLKILKSSGNFISL